MAAQVMTIGLERAGSHPVTIAATEKSARQIQFAQRLVARAGIDAAGGNIRQFIGELGPRVPADTRPCKQGGQILGERCIAHGFRIKRQSPEMREGLGGIEFGCFGPHGLAGGGAALVIAHGGQNNEAAQTVAAEFPGTQFAVTQGGVKSANLSSYEVLQEQSAWLAGAAAGLLTKTNVVGHMSGIRVRPGLKGRAAFSDGLRATNPKAQLLTNFSGTQDDNAVSRRIALAEIDAGADIIFTMLNAGRSGAIEACRARGARQIGNVGDWVKSVPDVFIASAIADVSMAVFDAAGDFHNGTWQPNVIRQLGLANPDAVRLALADSVPQQVRQQITQYAEAIAAGKIKVPDAYEGPEFNPA